MNKKFILFNAFALMLGTVIFAAPKYISPNNDGVQDQLELSLHISDKRYIQAWSFVILDSNKKEVRTIENKVALPEKMGFKFFFKQLITPKLGVEVPSKVVWNGAMNNGETAPDGKYYYYVTATDDNGNVGKTKLRTVYVDTSAPEVVVNPPLIKVFGEGERSSLRIRQSGSVEELWIGAIKNADGEIIKTYEWKDEAPTDFTWTGTNDSDAQVMDGIYSYEISSTDRAGNTSAHACVSNIIYSGSKPDTNIFINGSRYFSPGTDSKLQNIVFDLLIEVPDEKTGNKLIDWSVNIKNSKGKVVRSYNNRKDGNVPPDSIVFDGFDDRGRMLPDGNYQAEVSAEYLNGYKPDTLYSPVVILSTAKPAAQVVPSERVFGAGSKSTVDFEIRIDPTESAPVKKWNGYIKSLADSSVVKTYDFGEYPPDKITWDGISDKDEIAEGGKYYFEIVGEDLAGNVGGGKTSQVVTFDITESQLILGVSDTAFSPNNDNVRDIIKFTPVTMTKDVISYVFEINDENGAAVYSVRENGKLPVSFEWDGNGNNKINNKLLCNDGIYTAKLEIWAANGSSASATTQHFLLDTVAPSLVAEIPWNHFSTAGNGEQKDIPISIKSSTSEKQWNGEVRDSNDIAVSRFSWSGVKDSITWNGTNDSGNIVNNDVYSIIIFSTDEAGNSFSTEIENIVLDNRDIKAYLTAEYNGISPNNDNFLDVQMFQIKTSVQDGILSWKLDIQAEDGTSVYTFPENENENLPAEIIWNGADRDGNACEGTFIGVLDIKYNNSNFINVASSPFVCTATPPNPIVQTFPEFVSPDNDGVNDELYINLVCSTKTEISNWSFVIKDPVGNDFWTTKGNSHITNHIIWDGLSNVQKDKDGNAERVQSAMDYPFVFTVTDDLGMTGTFEGIISVDVLVIRVGDVLKMAVPSIIFEPDTSNFQTETEKLNESKVAKNIQILNRIAEILKKFSDYKVTIVGHANKITDNPDEETIDNLAPNGWGRASKPLSKERADVIRDYLISRGVNADSLSTAGMGGTEPVANTRDRNSNWKNRRVEFILQK